MSSIRPGRAMRQDFIRSGFDPALRYHERRRQRTALSLIAGLTLAISTVIVVTVVSIGIVQSEILAGAQSSDGTLAVAFLSAASSSAQLLAPSAASGSSGPIDRRRG